MSHTEKPGLPEFQPAVAEQFLSANGQMSGLPDYLDIRITSIEPGFLEATMEARPELITPFGTLHGGVVSALCDHVLRCACYPHMPPGNWAATTEFKLNLLAPVRGGTLTARTEILSMSRATAVVRIDILNDGRLCAAAQGTVLIRKPKT